MFVNVILLVIGLALLYYGSEWLVKGAADTAISYAIKPITVGLTIVAFATSAPELLVSLLASEKGASGISVGNILGSNVINIALVLGTSAMFRPLTVNKQVVNRDLTFMIAATLIFWLLCIDGNIGRIDGIALLTMLSGYLAYSLLHAKDEKKEEILSQKRSARELTRNILLIAVGLAGLIIGADLVVKSAVVIARKFGLSEVFIGISIVAFGTSLPELATSVTAVIRNESDISLGNVVGSNLFNICLVMGAVGVLSPISIDRKLHFFEFPVLLLISIILFFLSRRKYMLGKMEGAFFVFSFFAFTIISFLHT